MLPRGNTVATTICARDPSPRLARHLSTELGVRTPKGRGLAEAALDYLAWDFVMKRVRGRWSEDNQVLRGFLDDTAQRRPHPERPGRSIAEVLADERGHLRPLPAALDQLAALLRRGAEGDAAD